MLDQVRRKKRLSLLGYVIMPEHVHLLVSEPEEGNLSVTVQILKQQAARTLLRKPRRKTKGQLKLGFAEAVEKQLWQRRFYDFNIWSEAKFNEKLKYMHANPVKRGLVQHPKDWPCSSWSYYAKGEPGLIRIDSLEEKRGGKAEGKKSQNPHP
jgi:putative transposase